MGWWVLYSALCAALASFSERAERHALLVILAGLLVVQAPKLAGIEQSLWLFFAVTWTVCAATIPQVGAKLRHTVTISTLTLCSATCYFIGRVFGFEFAPAWPLWHSVLFWADMFLLGAILISGGPVIARVGQYLGGLGVGRMGRGGHCDLVLYEASCVVSGGVRGDDCGGGDEL